MRAAAATVLTITLLTGTARAQEEPVPEPEPEQPRADQPPDDYVVAPPVAEAPPEYDQAFEALARGDREGAKRLLTIVAQRGAGDPWGARAIELLDRLGGAPTAVPRGLEDDFRHERPTQGARAELALFQTITGIYAGSLFCAMIECTSGDSAVPVVLMALAGGGAGLGISLQATKGGLHAGHATLINSGSVWGIWNSIAMLAILDADDPQAIAGGLLLGYAGGTGLGLALWPRLHPTAGQVSLANTVGTWSLALTAFAQGAFFDELDLTADQLFGTMLVVGDLGVVGGAVLASRYATSRGRMLLIDAGGILGTLAGSGTAVLIRGNDTSREVFFRAMLPGAIVGLGAAAWLTRDWDVPDLPVSTSFMPAPGGGMAVIAGEF